MSFFTIVGNYFDKIKSVHFKTFLASSDQD